MKDRAQRRLLLVAVASSAGAATVFIVLVGTAIGQQLDRNVFQAAKSAQDGTSALEPFRLEIMTNPLLWISFAAAILVMGIAIRRPFATVAALAIPAMCIACARILRIGVLVRPQLDQSAPWPMANTFPSGHVAAAMGISLSLLLVAPLPMRLVGAVPCGVWVTLVTRDIIGEGWHRLSDVAGSVLLATAIAAFAAYTVSGRTCRPKVSTLVTALVCGPAATVAIATVLDPRPFTLLTGVLALGVALPTTAFASAL